MSDELTPEMFGEFVEGKLLIRSLVQVLPSVEHSVNVPTVRTAITLFGSTFTTQTEGDPKQLLCEVTYFCEERPFITDWSPFIGLEVHTTESADATIWEPLVQELLADWREESPYWLSPKQVVTCQENDGEFQEIPSAGIHMLQHFARLQTRLAYEAEGGHLGLLWFRTIFIRLCEFIGSQNLLWASTSEGKALTRGPQA